MPLLQRIEPEEETRRSRQTLERTTKKTPVKTPAKKTTAEDEVDKITAEGKYWYWYTYPYFSCRKVIDQSMLVTGICIQFCIWYLINLTY